MEFFLRRRQWKWLGHGFFGACINSTNLGSRGKKKKRMAKNNMKEVEEDDVGQDEGKWALGVR